MCGNSNLGIGKSRLGITIERLYDIFELTLDLNGLDLHKKYDPKKQNAIFELPSHVRLSYQKHCRISLLFLNRYTGGVVNKAIKLSSLSKIDHITIVQTTARIFSSTGIYIKD